MLAGWVKGLISVRRWIPLLGVAVGLSLPSGHAGEPPPFLNSAEYRQVAANLARKVNLFKDVWQQDPEAEFYGGTSRDFLYWVKGQFRGLSSREEVERKLRELEALPIVDVREFIGGESDIDILTRKSVAADPSRYGVTKIDTRGPELLDRATDVGKNELQQGHIPAEKIRMTARGPLVSPGFGDGIEEIYKGRLTVKFAPPEEFAKTHYAQQRMNHPILLALRYLRLQAMDYFQSYGREFPDPNRLHDMDPESARKVREVISGVLDGRALNDYLAKPQFKKWLNGTIQKTFRSYTNPSAGKELYKHFGAEVLPSVYEGIEPINQYLFATPPRDPRAIQAALERFKADPAKLFRPVVEAFPDGRLYHGTKSDEAFRSILLQGVLPSTDGAAAGSGLYGVDEGSRKFAEDWGGLRERLTSFKVKPEARIIDITQGEGARVWSLYQSERALADSADRGTSSTYDDFAKAFGADILKYPYGASAYVVKNSAVLDRPEGVYRKVLSLGKAVQLASEKKQSLEDLLLLQDSIKLNRFNTEETALILKALPENLSSGSLVRTPRDFWRFLGKIDDVSPQLLKAAGIDASALMKEWEGRDVWAVPASNDFDARTRLFADQLRALTAPSALRDEIRRRYLESFVANDRLRNSSIEKHSWLEFEKALGDGRAWRDESPELLLEKMLQTLATGTDHVDTRKDFLKKVLSDPAVANSLETVLRDYFKQPFALENPDSLFLGLKLGFLPEDRIRKKAFSDPHFAERFWDLVENSRGEFPLRGNPVLRELLPEKRLRQWLDRPMEEWKKAGWYKGDLPGFLADIETVRPEVRGHPKLGNWKMERFNDAVADARYRIWNGAEKEGVVSGLSFLLKNWIKTASPEDALDLTRIFETALTEGGIDLNKILQEFLAIHPWNRHPLRELWLEFMSRPRPQGEKLGARSETYFALKKRRFGGDLESRVRAWGSELSAKSVAIAPVRGGMDQLLSDVRSGENWNQVLEGLRSLRSAEQKQVLLEAGKNAQHLNLSELSDSARTILASKTLLGWAPENLGREALASELGVGKEGLERFFQGMPRTPPLPHLTTSSEAIAYNLAYDRVAHFLRQPAAAANDKLLAEVLPELPAFFEEAFYTWQPGWVDWRPFRSALEKAIRRPGALRAIRASVAPLMDPSRRELWNSALHQLYQIALPEFTDRSEGEFVRAQILAHMYSDGPSSLLLKDAEVWAKARPLTADSWRQELLEWMEKEDLASNPGRAAAVSKALSRRSPISWGEALAKNPSVPRAPSAMLEALQLTPGDEVLRSRVLVELGKKLTEESGAASWVPVIDHLAEDLRLKPTQKLREFTRNVLTIPRLDPRHSEPWMNRLIKVLMSGDQADPELIEFKQFLWADVLSQPPWREHPSLKAWERLLEMDKHRALMRRKKLESAGLGWCARLFSMFP